MIINQNNVDKHFREICILEHEKIRNLLKNDDLSYFIHNSDTGILYYPIPVGTESSQLMDKFKTEDIQPNKIYIFSKLENQYMELYESIKQAPLIKIKSIASICGNLGAKVVEIKQINYNNTSENLEVSSGGKIKEEMEVMSAQGEAKGSFISSIVTTLKQNINLKIEFKGEEHLDKALEIAQKSNLMTDVVIRDLIDNYKIIKTHELNIELFSEIKKITKLSTTLSIDASLLEKMFKGGMDLYFNMAKEIKSEHSLFFRMYVEF